MLEVLVRRLGRDRGLWWRICEVKVDAKRSSKSDEGSMKNLKICVVTTPASKIKGGEAFNFGTGKSTSIKELYYMLRDLLGSTLEPAYEAGTTEQYPFVADISKAKKLGGYSPIVFLKEGLSRLAFDIRQPEKND